MTENLHNDQVEITEEELLEDLRETKIADLHSYYDSKEIKQTTVNIQGSNYQLINDQKLRSLLSDKINILERKLSKILIAQTDAIFSFKINEETKIDLNIEELQELLFFLDEDRQSRFMECQNHHQNIKNLTSKQEIENYKIN